MLTFSDVYLTGGVMTGTDVVTGPAQQMTNMMMQKLLPPQFGVTSL